MTRRPLTQVVHATDAADERATRRTGCSVPGVGSTSVSLVVTGDLGVPAEGLHRLAEASRGFYRDRVPGRGPTGWDELLAMRSAMASRPVEAPTSPPTLCSATALGRSVPVRIHEPKTRPVGVVLEIHGGGFYMGSAAFSDAKNRRLCDALGCVVVSVDYRLAPEHPWPAAPADCETAALWLQAVGCAKFGTTRTALLGFSAGSTLAMTTLLRLRDRGVRLPDLAVLEFGTYDLSAQTPAGRLIADEYFLEVYAGGTPDRKHPDFSPIYADLHGLPPVMMLVGQADILLDDNLAMAGRLADAGVDVDFRVYPEAPHGFSGHPTPLARAANQAVQEKLRRHLG